jgi:quercetin dioxygenase-like cupin family protein
MVSLVCVACTTNAPVQPAAGWTANAAVPGAESAVMAGVPNKPGVYAMFGKMSQGTVFPPHAHPDDRITTVIQGVMYYAIGDTFDAKAVKAYPAGSVVFTAAGTPHYMWAKDGEVIMQESGSGPTGAKFLK